MTTGHSPDGDICPCICARTALDLAAEHFRTTMKTAWGGDASWLTTGTRVADLAASVLKEIVADADARLETGEWENNVPKNGGEGS